MTVFTKTKNYLKMYICIQTCTLAHNFSDKDCKKY